MANILQTKDGISGHNSQREREYKKEEARTTKESPSSLIFKATKLVEQLHSGTHQPRLYY